MQQLEIDLLFNYETINLGDLLKVCGTSVPKVQKFSLALNIPDNYSLDDNQINSITQDNTIYTLQAQKALHPKLLEKKDDSQTLTKSMSIRQEQLKKEDSDDEELVDILVETSLINTKLPVDFSN